MGNSWLLPLKLGCLSRLLVMSCVLLLDLNFDDYDTSAGINSSCLNASKLERVDVAAPEKQGVALFLEQLLYPDTCLEQKRRFDDIANPGNTSETLNLNGTTVGGIVARALEGLVVWDGVFMVRIAECGYEYEQFYAFFPLFPLLIRVLATTALRPLLPVLGFRATLALGGLLLSNISFILSAILLHRLSISVLKDEDAAYRATALYCFNPASIFYSSIYSESLFALLSFAGLVCLVQGRPWLLAAIPFGLSSLTRSNGTLHCGFFLFLALQRSFHLIRRRHLLRAVSAVLLGAVQSACVVAPFVGFQWYGYRQFCSPPSPPNSRGAGSGSVSPPARELRPWCYGRPPYLYGFVQSHYWDVGFLRYFQVKQIPNFFLALPVLSLAGAAIARFARARPRLFLSLGLSATEAETCALTWQSSADVAIEDREAPFKGTGSAHSTPPAALGGLRHRGGAGTSTAANTLDQPAPAPAPTSPSSHVENLDGKGAMGNDFFSNPKALCFVYQLAFMAAVATLVMYVQVATRFLSACPPLYWYGAFLTKPTSRAQQRLSFFSFLIWGWFLMYTFAGTLLFSNFYPFT